METNAIAPASSATLAGTQTRRPRRSPMRSLPRLLTPYLFVLPFLVLFLAFFIAPFIYAFTQSLYTVKHNGLGYGPPQVLFTGLGNYIKALHDPGFWDGFGRVLLFGAVQIPVEMILALILALLMDSAVIRFRRFFRLAFFLPYAVPGIVAAIMWSYFLQPGSSPIVQLAAIFNLPQPDFLGPSTVLWSIANIATWEFVGYNMIIFYSALQGISPEIYESGRIDGLSELGIALRLKVPLILPAVMFGLLFSLIGTIQLFNEPYILKTTAGSIASTYTPNIYAYTVAVINTDFNYGGTLAVILGVVTFIFSFGFLRLTRRFSGLVGA